MKKLILIILTLLCINLDAQNKSPPINKNNILEITFDIYINDKKLNDEYYFEINADSMGIHFKTTQPNKFTCYLTYNDNYCFEFKYKNSKPIIIELNGKNQPKRQYLPIKLTL